MHGARLHGPRSDGVVKCTRQIDSCIIYRVFLLKFKSNKKKPVPCFRFQRKKLKWSTLGVHMVIAVHLGVEDEQ